MICDHLWTNARLVVPPSPGRETVVVDNGLIASRRGRIVYAGPAQGAPDFAAGQIHDLSRRLVTPGLIDGHTHLVHAGHRAREFELRLGGTPYEEIARAGGGILSTMNATRAATEQDLVASALPRLDALLREGVTTVEIKSGYGLTLDDELKMLRAARALAGLRPVRIVTTFLGAHALPPEYAGRPDDYVAEVCDRMIPAVAAADLASAVDVFCEGIGFTLAQTERVFQAATAHGLRVKVHAEQLSNMHGAELAARHGALSADHLEHLDDGGIRAMASSGTVAMLLPGAFYFTRETVRPPVAALRDAGIAMALATDCNPGTSPLTSILLTMNMAATLFSMTVGECLAGVTRNAALALDLLDEVGTLETGKACDLAVWDAEDPAELVYRMGYNPLHARIFNGLSESVGT